MEEQDEPNQKNLFNKLYSAWEGTFQSEKFDENKEYIASEDRKNLIDGVKISHFYQTHVMPLPFWGNIKNPDYIVLSNNPSCEPMVDELESLFFYEELKNTLTNKTGQSEINWLDEKYDLKNILAQIKDTDMDLDKEHIKVKLEKGHEISLKSEQIALVKTLKKYLDKKNNQYTLTRFKTTYDWWYEVFDGIDVDKKKIYEKVGFFNLCGYHSRLFVPIKEKYLKKGVVYIETVDAVINYVKCLIKKGLKVILIWGTDWKKILFDSIEDNVKPKHPTDKEITDYLVEQENILVVNKYCSQNKSLKNYYRSQIKSAEICDKSREKCGEECKEKLINIQAFFDSKKQNLHQS